MQGWSSLCGRRSYYKSFSIMHKFNGRGRRFFGKVIVFYILKLTVDICCRTQCVQFFKWFHRFHHVNLLKRHARGNLQCTLIIVQMQVLTSFGWMRQPLAVLLRFVFVLICILVLILVDYQKIELAITTHLLSPKVQYNKYIVQLFDGFPRWSLVTCK